jgi:hypothetical protein
MKLMTQLGISEPLLRELIAAICHVLPTEDTHFQHLCGCQLGSEFWMKSPPDGFRQVVGVLSLHEIANYNSFSFHCHSSLSDLRRDKNEPHW